MNLEEMLGKVTDFIGNEANTKSVIGEEIKMGEYSCVPVIKVGIGFGSGGGEKETVGGGGGAGGAIGMQPIGFLVAGNGEIKFIPASTSTGLEAAINKLPDLIGKYMDLKKQNKKNQD